MNKFGLLFLAVLQINPVNFEVRLSLTFSARGHWFSQTGKTSCPEILCKKNFTVAGQTRQA